MRLWSLNTPKLKMKYRDVKVSIFLLYHRLNRNKLFKL